MSDKLTARERAAIAAYAGEVKRCPAGLACGWFWVAGWRVGAAEPSSPGALPPAQGMIHPDFDGVSDG